MRHGVHIGTAPNEFESADWLGWLPITRGVLRGNGKASSLLVFSCLHGTAAALVCDCSDCASQRLSG